MIIVGERINATRKKIAEAITNKNKELIQKEAKRQISAGAQFLDLNAGLGRGTEKEDLKWLIETVADPGDFGLCLDSADTAALKDNLKLVKNRKKMINSINGEQKKIETFLPVIEENLDSDIIALAMDDSGISCLAEDRIRVAEALVKLLTGVGLRKEQIFIDPLVQPVSTDPKAGRVFLDVLKWIKENLPGVQTICGLSNVSFGLPVRKTLNKYFMALAIGAGLDAAIVDPTEDGMQEAICAAEGLMGKDEFCLNYLTAFREGKIL